MHFWCAICEVDESFFLPGIRDSKFAFCNLDKLSGEQILDCRGEFFASGRETEDVGYSLERQASRRTAPLVQIVKEPEN